MGKGAAVRAGVGSARGRAIAFMDADLATDVSCLPDLLAALDHSHVAIGSRAMTGSIIEQAAWYRTHGGRMFNRITQALTGLPLLDTQCGFKAFRASAGKLLFQLSRFDGYAFDVELLALARDLHLRVAQVPVRWTDVKGSHIRPLLDPALMCRDVARTSARWRGGRVVAALRARCDPAEGHELALALRDHVRPADMILPVEDGVLTLLPASDPQTAQRVARRARAWLPTTRFLPGQVLPLVAFRETSGVLLRHPRQRWAAGRPPMSGASFAESSVLTGKP
jgi:hypothetical protein